MANKINDIINNLEQIDYTNIIDNLCKLLDSNHLEIDKMSKVSSEVGIFYKNGNESIIRNISELAQANAKQLSNGDEIKNILNLTGFQATPKSPLVSTNILNSDKHKNCFNVLCDKMIKELKGVYLECETIKDRKNVKCFKNINAGIAYGFPKLEGKVREMKAANQSNDIKKILFREDTAQISFDNTNLKELIKDNLISYYNKMDDEFEKEYKIDDLNKSNNLVDKISDFIITNRSGYLGRILEISIYLDFIVEFIKENECNLSECEKESLKILANYADRSKILEECINEATIGDFEKFSFDYDGIEVDLLKSFRGENVFEFLPIVGTKDTPELIIRNKEKELGIENYKMSLKLNGVVARSKKPSLEYNIWEINQHISKESYRNYEKNEIGIDLRNALLLEFFLINLADSNYDALEKFNNRVIRYKEDRILENRAGITTELKDIMSNIEMNLPEINKNITSIKTLIKNQFFNSCKSFERTYKKYFTIPTSALDVFESDSARNDLYKKYSILTNEPLPSEYCIHSYAYEIKLFSSVETIDDSESNVTSNYLIGPYKHVNYVFIPDVRSNNSYVKEILSQINNELTQISQKCFNLYIEYKEPYISNKENESKEKVLYEISFNILVHSLIFILQKRISSNIIQSTNSQYATNLDKMSIAKRNKLIYTTITQYVNAGKKNYHNEYTYSQDMVYRLRKNLEDSLSIRYISKSQGFECSTDKKEGYKASNAVCSMYSKLPRKYENNLGNLKKLKKAVILVARTSESDFKDGDALSRLLFDIYIVNGDNATFLPHGYPSDVSLNSINKKDIYSEISPYKDVASYLKELGYKHVVYVAKNPYTSNLIEKKGGNTELYLMNESVLNSMAEAGIYVYPIYFHKSKVQHDINRLFQDKNGNKLDISTIFTSIEEYKKNDFEDMEGIVPFAKIFTSSKANGGNIKGDANYSSLMTYLTLKGMYSEDKSYNIKNDEILEDREIREDILNILLALHASNNSKSNNEVLNIKSNPFEDDETAVWESSKKFFKVNQITYRFNYYAFSMLLEDYINDVLKDKDC